MFLLFLKNKKNKAHSLSLVNEKKRDEIKAKYKEKAMDSEKYRDELTALRAEYKTNVMSILTAEQVEKFKATYKDVGK
jgi:Spy/CpxP family protein refolding chaperone